MDEQPQQPADASPSGQDQPDAAPDGGLDFGPGGYLPDRASKRARKIVLRAPMGIQWVIGSLVVGVVVLVAGALLLRDAPPAAPFTELGPVGTGTVFGEEVEFVPLGTSPFGEVLVVDEGRPRVFSYTGPRPTMCEVTGLLETPDGRSWRVTGRGLGGAASLPEHPSVVYEGSLYADLTTILPTPEPDPEPVAQGCAPDGPAPSASPSP